MGDDRVIRIKDANGYNTMKTYIGGLVDVSLFTSNISQLLTITRSTGGVDTGEEIGRVVLLAITMFLQVVLMVILIYQGSIDINKLGSRTTPTPKRSGSVKLGDKEVVVPSDIRERAETTEDSTKAYFEVPKSPRNRTCLQLTVSSKKPDVPKRRAKSPRISRGAVTALSLRPEIGQSAERAPNFTKIVLKWNLYGDLSALSARPKTQMSATFMASNDFTAL
ncbi:hypothetical protein Bbelb_131360 [Branchiostoma belcheri]|nr:hypothetical protein Bbelb_131360 [Branchiostoma belcheri]